MENEIEFLRRLKEKVAAMPKVVVPETKEPGQVWSSTFNDDNVLPWEWLILAKNDDGTFEVAAIFPWLELAGPDDLFISSYFYGEIMIVSLEVVVDVPEDELQKFSGVLTEEGLEFCKEANRIVKCGDARYNYTFGDEYFGEYGDRYKYHVAIADHLATVSDQVI